MLSSDVAGELPIARAAAGDWITFSQLLRDVAHNAAWLRHAECKRGAVVCDDSYWFLVGMLALLHAGASVLLPHVSRAQALAELASHIDLFVCDHDVGVSSQFVLRPAGASTETLAPFDPDVSTVDFFTSGSTGKPKRVRRSVHRLEQEVEMLHARWNEVVGAAVVSATVPHHHIYGLAFKLLWPVCSNRPFACSTHGPWESVLAELEPGGVLVTSPAHLTRLAGIVPLAEGRSPSMILSAGAVLPPAAAQMANRIFGIPVTEIFGSTETGAFATRRSVTGDEPWEPFASVEIRRVENGVLALRAPHISGRSWLETSDVVDFMPDGRFRFHGRSDRIVKVEGKRVSLPEVEQRLRALPSVAAARATLTRAAPPTIGAAVVLTEEGKAMQSSLGNFRLGRALRETVAEALDTAAAPKLWRFVDRLPEGELGKLRDEDIAALFSGEKRS